MDILLTSRNAPIAAGTPVHTRRGTPIPTLRKLPRPPEALQAAKAMFDTHPRRLRSLDSTYNCIGLVFASRRAWIEPDHFATLCREDGYSEIGEQDVVVGDVVAYLRGPEAVHVGLVVNKQASVERCAWEITILSQWGQDGEYFHPPSDYPPAFDIGGKVRVTYFTERGREP